MNVLPDFSFNFYPVLGILPIYSRSFVSPRSLTQLKEAGTGAETGHSNS